VFTVVEHNVTLASEHFPDVARGARAVTETVTNTVQVNHLTENEDGSFHFVDFETGFLFADYDDPAIPDETFRRTNSESVNLTPGGTFTATETTTQLSAGERSGSSTPSTSPKSTVSRRWSIRSSLFAAAPETPLARPTVALSE
jgi:hypothetical protein